MTKGKPCLPRQGGGLYPLGCEEPLNYSDLKISVEGKGHTCTLERSLWEQRWGGFANKGDLNVRKCFKKP